MPAQKTEYDNIAEGRLDNIDVSGVQSIPQVYLGTTSDGRYLRVPMKRDPWRVSFVQSGADPQVRAQQFFDIGPFTQTGVDRVGAALKRAAALCAADRQAEPF